MSFKRNRLYGFILIICAIGYVWLLLHLFTDSLITKHGVCLFKHVTGLPCPSCGSTSSLIAILHGEFSDAFLLNPLGFVMLLVMVILPIWILFDLIIQKRSFLKVYQEMEIRFRRPIIYIPSILIILAIWIFNIFK